MAFPLINDILDELREENNRLLIENKEISELLSKYRNISLNFHKFCVCNQNSNNNSVIKSLEEEYQKFSKQKIIKSIKSETINESSEKTSIDKHISPQNDDKNTNESEGNSCEESTEDSEEYQKFSKQKIIKSIKSKTIDKSLEKTSEVRSPRWSKVKQNKCDFKGCYKRFITVIALEHHKKIVHQKEYIPCDYPGCGQTFKALRSYKIHLNELHPGHRLTCERPGCGKTFPPSDIYTYRSHELQHSLGQIPVKTDGSSHNLYFSSKHLKTYKRLCTKNFKCTWPNCEEAYITKNSLVAHINKKHKDVKPFKCTFEGCLKSFSNLKYLREHKKNMHSIERQNVKPVVHKCNECSFQSKVEGVLKAHFTQKHSTQEKTVECTFIGCTAKFFTEERMKFHLKYVHMTDKRFHCDWPGCDFSTIHRMRLDDHKRRHVGSRDFKCEFDGCHKSFVTKQSLIGHRATHRFACTWPECEQKFREEVSLTAHMNRHLNLNLRPFKCGLNDCNKDSSKHLETHKRLRPKNFKCTWPNCDEAYNGNNALVAHINKKHKDVKPFKCTFEGCLKSFSNLKYLREHKKNMHSIERQNVKPVVHKCSECGFESKVEGVLKAHFTQKHSTQEKTVECTFIGCSVKFLTEERMQRHLRYVHVTDKRFHCDWPGCDYSTVLRTRLDDHKRRHVGSRDFKCDFEGCDKYFVTKQCLIGHRASHLKRFVCSWPECQQRFSQEVYLTAHMNRHLNLRPFKCSFKDCKKDFRIDEHLNIHIRSIHKINPKDLKRL